MMIKKIIIVMLSLFLLLPVVAYAQEGGSIIYRTNTVAPIDSNSAPNNTNANTNDSRFRMDNSLNNGYIPHVTIDDATSWIDRKGYDIIRFLQKVAQPFSIVVFIIGAFFLLLGALGGTRLGSKGLWGMVVAVIIYTVSIYAPELVQMFSNWLSS